MYKDSLQGPNKNYDINAVAGHKGRKEVVESLLAAKMGELLLRNYSGERAIDAWTKMLKRNGRLAMDEFEPNSTLDAIAETALPVTVWGLQRYSESQSKSLSQDLKGLFGGIELVLHKIVSAADRNPAKLKTIKEGLTQVVSGIILAMLQDAEHIGIEPVMSFIEKCIGNSAILQGKRRPLLIKRVLDSDGINTELLWTKICELFPEEGLSTQGNGTVLDQDLTGPIISVTRKLMVLARLPISICLWSNRTGTPRIGSIHYDAKQSLGVENRMVLLLEDKLEEDTIIAILPLKLRLIPNITEPESKRLSHIQIAPAPAKFSEFTFHVGNDLVDRDIEEFLGEYVEAPIGQIVPISPESMFRFILKHEYSSFSKYGMSSAPVLSVVQTSRRWKLLQFDVIKGINKFLDHLSESSQKLDIQADLAESRKRLNAKTPVSIERGASTTIDWIIVCLGEVMANGQ